MSTLEDLNIKSILDMTNEEAIEHLRQIRLSRRTVKPRTVSNKKQETKAKTTKAINNMSKEQASNLLKLLGDIQ